MLGKKSFPCTYQDFFSIATPWNPRLPQTPIRTTQRMPLFGSLLESPNTSVRESAIRDWLISRTRFEQTRRALSWIWTTESRTPNPDDESDDILRAEWVKSRARAARCREEVLLLKEEMRRVIAFLDWKAAWWVDRQGARTDVTRNDLHEGLHAYAETQADLQKALKEEFCTIWKVSLDDSPASLEEDVGDGDEDEDDECDDEEGDDSDGGDGGGDLDGDEGAL